MPKVPLTRLSGCGLKTRNLAQSGALGRLLRARRITGCTPRRRGLALAQGSWFGPENYLENPVSVAQRQRRGAQSCAINVSRVGEQAANDLRAFQGENRGSDVVSTYRLWHR